MSLIARALATAVTLAWGAVALGQAPTKKAPPPASQLEPIEVLGNPEPLDQELARLRRKVRDSTPCLGCDAPKAKDSVAQQAFNYIFRSTPPEPTREDKDARYVWCLDAGPGMDNVC